MEELIPTRCIAGIQIHVQIQIQIHNKCTQIQIHKDTNTNTNTMITCMTIEQWKSLSQQGVYQAYKYMYKYK